jgi:predicted nucleotidyltransferase
MGSHYRAGERPSPDEVHRTLVEVVRALRSTEIPYLLMGGVGTATMARPRTTDDVDLFVRPDDAPEVLTVLEDHGFTTEVADPIWLYKAFRHGVLVDVIFRSIGDIYLDDQMLERAQLRQFKGTTVPVIAPEDLLVIKAVATSEQTPHHWFDALAVIARCELDWNYVVTRARSAGPRRVLSLMLYAESIDLAIPIEPIRDLLAHLYPEMDL